MLCSRHGHPCLPAWKEAISSVFLLDGLRHITRAVELLKKEVAEKLPADLDGLQNTLKKLQELLERAHAYVDDVVVHLFWPSLPRCAR